MNLPPPTYFCLSLSIKHMICETWKFACCIVVLILFLTAKRLPFCSCADFYFLMNPNSWTPPPPFSASLMFGSADHRPVVTVAGIGLVCALLVVVKGPFVFGKLRQTSLINVSKSNLPNFTHAICLKAFSQPTTHKDVSQENLKDWTGGRLCSKWGRRIRLQPFACLIGQTF